MPSYLSTIRNELASFMGELLDIRCLVKTQANA